MVTLLLAALDQTIVATALPRIVGDRGGYQGLIGGVFAGASIAGPAVGGFLVDNASWRWVFYVNLPVGGLALLVISLTMPKRAAPRREHSIDWTGAAALVAAVVAFVLFGLVERRARETILPFDLLRNSTVAAGIDCVALVGMTMLG